MASASIIEKVTVSARRILILTPAISELQMRRSPLFPFLHALTGVQPPPEQGSFAGYTQHQPLRLVTKYYACDVGLWCDELPISRHSHSDATTSVAQRDSTIGYDNDLLQEPTLASWTEQMVSEEAEEVRKAIGGIILLLPLSVGLEKDRLRSEGLSETIQAVNKLRECIEDAEHRDIASLVLLQVSGATQEGIEEAVQIVEETVIERLGILGWDVVGWNGDVDEATKINANVKRNTDGEKTGFSRVREVLEAVDWSTNDTADVEGDADFIDSEYQTNIDRSETMGADGIKLQGQELEREIMGLKLAMAGFEDEEEGQKETNKETNEEPDEWPNNTEEEAVDKLQGLMERVMAIREAATEMAPEEKEKFTKREISKIMQEIS